MQNAELYATSSGLQQQFVSLTLQQLWKELDWESAAGTTVLDVGCGPGDVMAKELLPRLPHDVRVVATDVSAAMLRKAAARFAGPRLCFRQLDIATHNIEDTDVWQLGPYSKVFSFFCLHWVQDQRLALENINKLLRCGGEVLFVLVSQDSVFRVYEILAKTSHWGPYMKDYMQFMLPYGNSAAPESDLRSYLKEAGFSVRTCYNERDIRYVSMDEQKLIDTLTAINPFVCRVPEKQQKAFIQDTVKEAYNNGVLTMRCLPSGTTYAFHYNALVVHAVKV